MQAGMDAFMTKPVNLRQLKELLSEFAADDGGGIIEGRGLLGEMAASQPWSTIKERWLGIFESHVAELQAVLNGEDPEAARKVAHKLLGHLRMLKTRGLADFLVDMNTCAHAGDMAGMRKEWEGFQAGLDRFRDEFGRI